ncbi:hypothetical protein FAES_2589 [Fibrella aestuarina BUZ 2]|uniref:Macroglobulin domain-containing protein n=1 Tax=Fibrella aestuarina BUZ 2 TaxID=1166018 RepID=I0K8Z5_9BACT|nr:hypothetical protein [Fibrella aestuarina]CCH00598.1 hypothetical protein FAES_2589 [Fibrella aestuarina BUZ 2]
MSKRIIGRPYGDTRNALTTKITSWRNGAILALLLLVRLAAVGQTTPSADWLFRSFDTYRRQALTEKLFVHTDQAFYLTGESMWFKLYYVDGTYHKPLDLSKVAYLELLDGSGTSVLRTAVALSAAGGNGALSLPTTLPSGTYRLRGYTNWMKNGDAAYFFEKNLTIVNPFRRLGLKLPRETVRYDVQFFPEGGYLVQGLTSRVAFRVADETGRGINARGWLLNAKNDTLAQLTTQHLGKGSFTLTPGGNVAYRAMFVDEKGRTFSQPLPSIQPQGYVMRLEDISADQLQITVTANVPNASVVYLFAHTRQVIDFAEARPIQRETSFRIDKAKLGDGISHLTLFDAKHQPIGERLYFKRPTNPLAITLKTDQAAYATRFKVTLTASVQGSEAAKAGSTTLSMAVYRLDSLATSPSEHLLSYLWLSSDLPGPIESPESYWQTDSPQLREATDLLMLTQGWRRFRWNDILTPARPGFRYLPEYNGQLVEGQLTDPQTGKPVPGVLTYLSAPGKPTRLYVSRSDTTGRVYFELRDFWGAQTVLAQTNPADSLHKLTIRPPYAPVSGPLPLPEPAVSESQQETLLSRSVAMQVQQTYWGDQLLRYQAPIVDSLPFYVRPSERYQLDAYTRFPRMEEVLREYVRGVMPRKKQGRFQLNVVNLPFNELFTDNSLVLVDGVPVFDMDKVMEFSPLKVQQIDVVSNNYGMGPAMFNGIVSFMTYRGDLSGFPLPANVVKLDYEGLQLQREFYAPRYETARQFENRLPDKRTLLYWQPNLSVDVNGNARTDFFTSDQTGTYLIEVNGLSTDGAAGYQRTVFTVQSRPK